MFPLLTEHLLVEKHLYLELTLFILANQLKGGTFVVVCFKSLLISIYCPTMRNAFPNMLSDNICNQNKSLQHFHGTHATCAFAGNVFLSPVFFFSLTSYIQ